MTARVDTLKASITGNPGMLLNIKNSIFALVQAGLPNELQPVILKKEEGHDLLCFLGFLASQGGLGMNEFVED